MSRYAITRSPDYLSRRLINPNTMFANCAAHSAHFDFSDCLQPGNHAGWPAIGAQTAVVHIKRFTPDDWKQACTHVEQLRQYGNDGANTKPRTSPPSALHLTESPGQKLLLTIPAHSLQEGHMQALLARWKVMVPCDARRGPPADLMFVTSPKHSQNTLRLARLAVEGMDAAVRSCFKEVLYLTSDLPESLDDYSHGPPWTFLWTMLRSGMRERGYHFMMQVITRAATCVWKETLNCVMG